jgi:hypothetical protein
MITALSSAVVASAASESDSRAKRDAAGPTFGRGEIVQTEQAGFDGLTLPAWP